jgi:hypothetical protein
LRNENQIFKLKDVYPGSTVSCICKTKSKRPVPYYKDNRRKVEFSAQQLKMDFYIMMSIHDVETEEKQANPR